MIGDGKIDNTAWRTSGRHSVGVSQLTRLMGVAAFLLMAGCSRLQDAAPADGYVQKIKAIEVSNLFNGVDLSGSGNEDDFIIKTNKETGSVYSETDYTFLARNYLSKNEYGIVKFQSIFDESEISSHIISTDSMSCFDTRPIFVYEIYNNKRKFAIFIAKRYEAFGDSDIDLYKYELIKSLYGEYFFKISIRDHVKSSACTDLELFELEGRVFNFQLQR